MSNDDGEGSCDQFIEYNEMQHMKLYRNGDHISARQTAWYYMDEILRRMSRVRHDEYIVFQDNMSSLFVRKEWKSVILKADKAHKGEVFSYQGLLRIWGN